MMTLASIAELCGITSTCLVGLAWLARKFIRDEVLSLLKNDDTSVATYMHQVRDELQETKKLLIEHVTDYDAHSR